MPASASPQTSVPSVPAAREPHIAALDGLRAIAVTAVFLLHYGGGNQSNVPAVRTIAQLSAFGSYGVTLFFLLSGFLITGILFDSREDAHYLRSFYIRRSLRVAPLYYTVLLIYAAVALGTGVFRQAWNMIWVLALYLQNVNPFMQMSKTITVPLWTYHFWSLAVEEHFYLIWPFLLARVDSRRGVIRVCGGVWLFSLIFQIAVRFYDPRLIGFDGALFINAGALSLGGLLAMLYRGNWVRWAAVMPWVAGISFLLTALLAWHPHSIALQGNRQQTAGDVAITFFLAALLSMALQPGWWQRSLAVGWLRYLGKISFGLYVYHVFCTSAFNAIASRLAGTDQGTRYLLLRPLVAAAGSILLAALSYRWLERPWLKLKDRLAPRSILTAQRLEATYTGREAEDPDRIPA